MVRRHFPLMGWSGTLPEGGDIAGHGATRRLEPCAFPSEPVKPGSSADGYGNRWWMPAQPHDRISRTTLLQGDNHRD